MHTDALLVHAFRTVKATTTAARTEEKQKKQKTTVSTTTTTVIWRSCWIWISLSYKIVGESVVHCMIEGVHGRTERHIFCAVHHTLYRAAERKPLAAYPRKSFNFENFCCAEAVSAFLIRWHSALVTPHWGYFAWAHRYLELLKTGLP